MIKDTGPAFMRPIKNALEGNRKRLRAMFECSRWESKFLDIQDSADGCLAGLLIGDALDGQVEFQSRERIRRSHPDGVHKLEDGGVWNTAAGQSTDDGEMALALSGSIVTAGGYDRKCTRQAYDA